MIRFRKTLSVAGVAGVISYVAVVQPITAAAAAKNVTYTASGTFAPTPVKGNDLFKLAGQPFSISVVASEALVSQKHGKAWAIYQKLTMTGTVQSGLIPTPTSISNNSTSIQLAFGNPAYDVFGLGTGVKVVGITLNISATIQMPKGTISNDHILPLKAPVTLTPTTATMVYSDGTNSTTLGLNGTLSTTAAAPTTGGAVMLHAAGAQAITVHADGTKSVSSAGAGVVESGASTDSVALQFYAAGLSGASDVHVQIAGQDVPVLYAGPSGHFPGLDQVSVQVPRSLAWIGDTDAVLAVDGQTSQPVRIRIQ